MIEAVRGSSRAGDRLIDRPAGAGAGDRAGIRPRADRGLDPDLWRDNVERLALEDVGVQPIRYVDNIEKYYVAYTMSLGLREEREEALRAVRER